MKELVLLSIALCCLPQSHLGFCTTGGLHAGGVGAVSASPKTSLSCGRSLKRPRTDMMASDSLAAVEQPVVDEVDGQATWAKDSELDFHGKVMLKGLLFSETQQLMERLGEKPGRAEVLAGWLYQDRRLIRDIAETAGGGGGDGGATGRAEDATNSNSSNSLVSSKSRIGKKTRDAVREVATADGGLELEDVQLAADGTRKLVSVLTSGEGAGKKVETVIIPMLRGPQREPRYTVCVSSQVGCAMNCQFCFTGRLGLMANLQAAQIVEQVLVAKRYLESVGDPSPVTGVVFMGMGEPFDNYDRVMRAVKILTDPRAGVRLKASSVTVSTVGLVPQIETFCKDPANGASLAISLHAVVDEVRDKLIPVNRRYPLKQLSETLRTHFPRSPKHATDDPTGVAHERSRYRLADRASSAAAPALGRKDGVVGSAEGRKSTAGPGRMEWEQVTDLSAHGKERRPPSTPTRRPQHRPRPPPDGGGGGGGGGGSNLREGPRRSGRTKSRRPRILAVEYTLLGGVNDSLEDAGRLAGWLEGVACVVNLITFNAHAGTPFSPSSPEAVEAFRRALAERGQLCTFRDSRGDDGMAACGQLGGESMAGGGDRARKPVPVTWKSTDTPSTA